VLEQVQAVSARLRKLERACSGMKSGTAVAWAALHRAAPRSAAPRRTASHRAASHCIEARRNRIAVIKRRCRTACAHCAAARLRPSPSRRDVAGAPGDAPLAFFFSHKRQPSRKKEARWLMSPANLKMFILHVDEEIGKL